MSKRVCLHCGKEIQEGLWHRRCIQRFFHGVALPSIQINLKELEHIATAQLREHKGVAGAQEKLSLHLDLSDKKRPQLTPTGLPSDYLLKPQSPRFTRLPENEHTAMLLAECCDILTVPHGLIPINGNGELAYITKRIDRDGKKKIHMEDFCQATGNITANKYRSSYEECVALIMTHSKVPVLDKMRLFTYLYFCFLIGNSDLHLKNLSFIMDEQGRLSLAPFYDILGTKIVLKADHQDLGMLFNGKNSNLRKHDFDQFAANVGIPQKVQYKIMGQIDGQYKNMCQIIDESMLDQNSKSAWKAMILSGIKRVKRP